MIDCNKDTWTVQDQRMPNYLSHSTGDLDIVTNDRHPAASTLYVMIERDQFEIAHGTTEELYEMASKYYEMLFKSIKGGVYDTVDVMPLPQTNEIRHMDKEETFVWTDPMPFETFLQQTQEKADAIVFKKIINALRSDDRDEAINLISKHGFFEDEVYAFSEFSPLGQFDTREELEIDYEVLEEVIEAAKEAIEAASTISSTLTEDAPDVTLETQKP